jgi:alanyl-tRNA synthetase
MQSRDVRRAFLEFFRERDHQIVPSSPLILPQDPTLLFANAGMNQFKEVFRGQESRPYRRAVSSQKCLRVSGKHNDLEEVGRTPRHHTFFEMLGNFSFGDYFKQDAIGWAWELVTEVYKIPAQRLYVTVFKGDEQIPADEDAARIWRESTGIAPDRIVRLGRKDNFWQMGDTGPAGPCTEIHVDMRPAETPSDPEQDPGRYLEIWNLVFMQYDLQVGGGLELLPAPCVDTGAGLERLTAVLGGYASNYDTDLFQPIIQSIAASAQRTYGSDTTADVSLRVISDHLRAITMLTAEGVIPGPEKRGAVLRRIMRRALRHGRMLGLPTPFLYQQVPLVIEILGETFPDLSQAAGLIQKITRREEERFDRTLAAGFARLDERIGELLASGAGSFPGQEAFQLESEQGMPLDLIRDALDERGLAFESGSYESARRKHVETSRVVKPGVSSAADSKLWSTLTDSPCEFVGRNRLRVEAARVTSLLRDGRPVRRLAAGERGIGILDQTPFYAESGGQQGDRGRWLGPDLLCRITDTVQPGPGVIAHTIEVEIGAIEVGALIVAEVDAERRRGAARHHTATHLVHAALRRQLGPHVKQAGSLVAPDRLRFDFAHYEAIPAPVMGEIEAEVNQIVLSDLEVETTELPLEQALASGAMAFFGDRYGERVRVVRIGEYSLELCGGTHVARTGELGTCLTLGEKGVAAGVRRLEAIVGAAAQERIRRDLELLAALAGKLGSQSGEAVGELDRRLDQLRKLQRENEELRMKLAQRELSGAAQTIEVEGIQVIARRADGLARHQRRDLADSLRQQHPGAVVILGAEDEGKAALVVAVGAHVGNRIDARELVQRVGPLVGGGGGGRPDLVEAGGKNPNGLEAALAHAPQAVREILTGRP